MQTLPRTNSLATVEVIEKNGPRRNEDYRAECYGVFTQERDYWFSGFVSVCRTLAREKFEELKRAGITCELVDAMHNEDIDSYGDTSTIA